MGCTGKTTRRALFGAFAVWALSSGLTTDAAAQTPPPQTEAPLPIPKMVGTNIVFGSVVADATGRPVKGASVTVIVFSGAATFLRNTTTDRQGRFLIGGLDAARVRVSASAPGFLSTSIGQNGPDDANGTYVPLVDGEPLGPVTLRLIKPGVITGAIVDEANEPMASVLVQVFKRSYANGVRQFAPGETARTDDRGVYRISGLISGTYVVGIVPRVVTLDNATLIRAAQTGSVGLVAPAVMSGMSLSVDQDAASAGAGPLMVEGAEASHVFSAGSPAQIVSADGRPLGYGPTFFPGTSPSSAQLIPVGPAEEKTANFQMISGPLAPVAGRVVGPDGAPPAQTALALVRQGDEGVQIGDTLTALVGASGDFSFDEVPAGAYHLVALSWSTASPSVAGPVTEVLWARMPIAVGDRARPIAVSLHAGARIAGEVRFDGAAAPAGEALKQWRVSLTNMDSSPALTRAPIGAFTVALDVSGRFTIDAVLRPGDYTIQVGTGLPGPWSLASVSTGSAESVDGILHISGDDIEHATIVMTDKPTMVTGAVSDAEGKTVTDVTVIAFPRDPQLWVPNTRRIASARPSTDGTYQLKELPPGDYIVAVVRTVERGQWFDPEFLAGLQAGAERLSVGAGERKTLDLKIR